MAAAGDPTAWAARFRTVDARLLERICVVWPKCRAVLVGQPIEDHITVNLIDVLWKDEVVRRLCYWIEYQFEPFSYLADGRAVSTGRIDMAVILDQDRTQYLAYECKRLNLKYQGGNKSNAKDYVSEGLARFVTEQYAEKLPVGCMLGYVMDGDCPAAVSAVHAAISADSSIHLLDGPTTAAPIQCISRFTTTHARADGSSTIEVRHALFSF